MGQQERVSRRTVTASAQLALDKVAECITALNVQADRVTLLNQHQAALETKFTALETGVATVNADQRKQLDAVSTRLTTAQGVSHAQCMDAVGKETTHRNKLAAEQRHYVDTQDVKLARMIEQFQQMGLRARLRWVFTGRI